MHPDAVDGWTALEPTPSHPLPATVPGASPEAVCPGCGGAARDSDLRGVLGLTEAEVGALRRRRFGALECADCHALFPWEA